jgi:hypothetical protein
MIHFNIIKMYYRSPMTRLSFRPSDKILYEFLILSVRTTCPVSLLVLDIVICHTRRIERFTKK